ncbi:MAG: glutamate--tRNA ligase, partial [bacterium]
MNAPGVRTRYAGSPTGYLHIGGAWACFFNWLFARHHEGALAIRVEDTDQKRSTREFEGAILEDIRWLGLDWEEGPDVGGPFGPYRQTERFDLYTRYADDLRNRGAAYLCYCTAEELEAERRLTREQRRPYRYSGRCRTLSDRERARFEAEGRHPVVRMRIRDFGRAIVVQDLIRDRVEFSPEHLDDYIIVRSDGSPLYNFANVVDDHLMEISHSIRGAEHLSNTPKQLVMYDALGWAPPQFAHLPVILGADRKKLSKRHGDTALRDYRRQGYLPEALRNFFALMGWYPEEDREIYSLEELIGKFRIEEIGKSPAVFDLTKLTWMNGLYMRQMMERDSYRVVDLAVVILQEHGLLPERVSEEQRTYVARVVEALGDRIKVGEDVLAYGDFFFREVTFDQAAVDRYLRDPAVPALLVTLAQRIESGDGWNRQAAEEAVRRLAEEQGVHSR